MKKKKKYHSHEQLKDKILENHKTCFYKEPKYQDKDITSWTTVKETNNKTKLKVVDLSELKGKRIYTRKYILKLSEAQKKIINKYFEESNKVYNAALRYIKRNKLYKNPECKGKKCLKCQERKCMKKIKFEFLRDNLKSQTHEIRNVSRVHDLERTINVASSMYNSAITNFSRGYINSFKIRYKKPKKHKVCHFESTRFTNGKIPKIGEIKMYDKGKEIKFLNFNHEFSITKQKGKYYILVLLDKEKEDKKVKREEFISLDPGSEPFLTGVSKDNSYVFGNKCSERLKSLFLKIDNVRNKNLLNILRNKIKNLVTDLHWKTMNYLTSKFNSILIGNLSSKSCVEGKLSPLNKRVLSALRIFEFRRKLEWKCKLRGVKYEEVNEYLTSKTCSFCGTIKKDLGGSKVYDCSNCKKTLNRDLNGARNIYFVSKIGS